MEGVWITCANCHVQFAISKNHDNNLLASKKSFYCPNGHSQSYTGISNEEEIKRLKEKLENEKENKKKTREFFIGVNNSLENKLRTYKGHLTRCKNKKGVK